MRVKSWEEGSRPSLFTRARQQAPQARAALTSMLASQDFAHMAFVVLDWTGLIAFVDGDGRSQDMPPGALDKSLPVMYIQVIKSMPQYGGSIVVEHRLDIDDMFGGNVISATDLAELVVLLKDGVAEQESRVRQEAP